MLLKQLLWLVTQLYPRHLLACKWPNRCSHELMTWYDMKMITNYYAEPCNMLVFVPICSQSKSNKLDIRRPLMHQRNKQAHEWLVFTVWQTILLTRCSSWFSWCFWPHLMVSSVDGIHSSTDSSKNKTFTTKQRKRKHQCRTNRDKNK